jgi:hypothetical protein
MTEEQKYWYNKGKYDGMIEGRNDGIEAVADILRKSIRPVILNVCYKDMSETLKFVEEQKQE